MKTMVVPHHPTTSSVELWVTQYGFPWEEQLELTVMGESGDSRTVNLGDYGWLRLGAPAYPGLPDTLSIFFQVHVVDGLEPDSGYVVRLRTGSEARDIYETFFETLPRRLIPTEAASSGQRPFTMLLGSCYWVEEDNGSVAERYALLYRNRSERPHLKLLVGDQVYVDQLPQEFGCLAPVCIPPGSAIKKSTAELESFITARYTKTWERQEALLALGANICISDDHEYWNDYPDVPVHAVWPHLHSESFRRTMKRITNDFVDKVQRVRPVEQWEIGDPPQLSVFVADTRINRLPRASKFMADDDFARMLDWIDGLSSPGVLVLGQPLFTPPRSYRTILKMVTDRNLPAFTYQYGELAKHLHGADHDICVLSGDVHFGRIARVRFPRYDKSDPTTLYEVIASPMAQLPKSGSTFERNASDTPRSFPNRAIWSWHAPGVIPGVIEWVKTVPTTAASDSDNWHVDPYDPDTGWPYIELGGSLTPVNPNDPPFGGPLPPQRTQEHFMTLAFSDAGDGAVHVRVSAWLVRRTRRPDGLPHLAWREEFTLRSRKKGLDIPGARALLLEDDLPDVAGARSLLLEEDIPDISAARSLLLEQEDITDISGARSLLLEEEV